MRRAGLAASLLLIASAAVGESGQTGARILLRTEPAAPAALGGAHAAVSGRLSGIFHNPAGAAGMRSAEAQATYHRGLVDDSIGGLAYGHPFGFGTVFISGGYFDAGDIDVNLSNGTQGTRKAQQDSVGGIGLAVGRKLPVSIGAAVKFYRLELAEEASASGYAIDAGVLWRTPVAGLSLGASAANAGSDVKFEAEGDPLPLTSRAGAAYDFDLTRIRWLKNSDMNVLFVLDGVKERDDSAAVRTGLELRRKISGASLEGSAALRVGYQSDPQTVTVGLGVAIGGLVLDYALGVVDDLDSVHRATIAWRFKVREK